MIVWLWMVDGWMDVVAMNKWTNEKEEEEDLIISDLFRQSFIHSFTRHSHAQAGCSKMAAEDWDMKSRKPNHRQQVKLTYLLLRPGERWWCPERAEVRRIAWMQFRLFGWWTWFECCWPWWWWSNTTRSWRSSWSCRCLDPVSMVAAKHACKKSGTELMTKTRGHQQVEKRLRKWKWK